MSPSDDVVGVFRDDHTSAHTSAPTSGHALALDLDPGEVRAVVLDAGRGSLPFHLIHGESLVAAAAWAVGEAGIDLLDMTITWSSLVEDGAALLLHDPLCPMTPPAFLTACAVRALADDAVVVGVRPVTDTVKHLDTSGEAPLLGETVDRDSLVAVCSPVVLGPGIVTDLLGGGGPLPSTDLGELLTLLRERYGARVVLLEAPPEARRVADDADIAALAALTDPR